MGEIVYWVDNSTMSKLIGNVHKNKQSYMSGDFKNFFHDHKNNLRDVGVKINLTKIKNLSGSSKDEVDDSCKIYSAISGMHPSLAVRANIWMYLSHTHLLEYGRKRWLSSEKAIQKHFLSPTAQMLRDDHASSRPWWNAHIASKIAGSNDISKIKAALLIFARTTDTRMSTIERPTVFGDIHLARLILKKLKAAQNLKR